MASRKVTYLSPFYGYPPETISQWCCVSVQTARAYKNGSKRPSRSVLKLFRLHKEMRVLTGGWDGWSVDDRGIWDAEGNCTTAAQLGGYWLIMQYAAEVASLELQGIPAMAELQRLLRRA
jgi:hypothetical protein